MTTTYNITYNAQYDSHEVTFESKPATAVLDALKALKMRWNPKKACWYGFAKESEILFRDKAAYAALKGEAK